MRGQEAEMGRSGGQWGAGVGAAGGSRVECVGRLWKAGRGRGRAAGRAGPGPT